MHPDELANWLKIKEVFEAEGTTDNFYYKRACVIVAGGSDPMNNIGNGTQDDPIET